MLAGGIALQGVNGPDKKGIVGVPLLCQLLIIVSETDIKKMFVNIEGTAGGSGCTIALPKKYGGEARDYLNNLGFRLTEIFGGIMGDLFTTKERERM